MYSLPSPFHALVSPPTSRPCARWRRNRGAAPADRGGCAGRGRDHEYGIWCCLHRKSPTDSAHRALFEMLSGVYNPIAGPCTVHTPLINPCPPCQAADGAQDLLGGGGGGKSGGGGGGMPGHVVRPGGGTLPAVRRRLHAWSLCATAPHIRTLELPSTDTALTPWQLYPPMPPPFPPFMRSFHLFRPVSHAVHDHLLLHLLLHVLLRARPRPL